MIIGDNNNINNNSNFNNNTSFENTFKRIHDIQNNNENLFTNDKSEHKYTNPSSRSDMNDKALAILQERYRNGLISLEEFNRKCTELARRRNN